MKRNASNNGIKQFLPDLLISLASSFLLIYVPVQVYIANELDFSFDVYDVLHYSPLFALVVFLLLMGILALTHSLGERLHSVVLSLVVAGFFVLLFHGVFLTKDLPLLDGTDIDWTKFQTQKLISRVITAGCVIVLLAASLFTGRKFLPFASYTGVFGFLFLLVSLVLSCVSNPSAMQPRNTTVMTADGAFDMSEDQNFIIFLLDGMEEDWFETVLEEYPEYRDTLADFTSFTDTMCMYPYTTRSIPYILFGKLYDNSLNYSYYLRDAIDESPFFQKLREENYDQRVYFEYLYLTEIPNSVFQNFKNVETFNEPIKFCKMLLKLSGLQYLPYDLKPFCVLTPENIYFDSLKANKGETIDYYSFNNKDLYNRILDTEIPKSEKNCFRFYYAQGPHTPWLYDEDLNEVENGTYIQAIRGSLTLVDTWLQKLKDKGVYDNTVIVILADHGYVPSDPESDIGKQHPFMIIKGKDEHHPFAENNAPISHEDLQQAYLRLMEGASADEAFPWKEGDIRERLYMYSDVVIRSDIYEYSTSSDAADTEALIPTGRVFQYNWETAEPKNIRLSG